MSFAIVDTLTAFWPIMEKFSSSIRNYAANIRSIDKIDPREIG